jgi:capsular exopolysaccharide synthesis family protein
MRAFVVTSAGIAEGKTLTALNLAWLLAQTDGVRALVIDSDLRQPCATDYLGIDAPVGLSEVLGGQARLEEAIVKLDPAGLYLLPGGQPRDDVAELLSGPTYARLLTDVRRMFDYIIIDAPPLGIFTDANVLISRADGALLVVRAGKTRYNAVDKLLEQLPRERLLGVVLNRVDEQIDQSSYYYQHRYYSRDRRMPNGNSKHLNGDRAEEEVAIVN